MAQTVKNLPVIQETGVESLGGEDPLEEGMEIHFSILAWRIPQTEEPGGLQSMGSPRVRHDWRDWAPAGHRVDFHGKLEEGKGRCTSSFSPCGFGSQVWEWGPSLSARVTFESSQDHTIVSLSLFTLWTSLVTQTVKNPPAMQKILWRREWLPTPVFLPGKSRGQRSPKGYCPWDCKELDRTEPHFHPLISPEE